MYQLVLFLSVDHQSLLNHLRFQLLQCSHLLLDAETNLSPHGICSDAAPQDQNRQRTANQTRTPGTDVARTASLALQFDTCRCCIFVPACCLRGIGVTVFGHRGYGARGPFATDQHLTIHTSFRAIIQIESDDTVASSMNNDTAENFDRQDCACAVQ